MSIFPEIQYMEPNDQERARRNLLAYCELDTLAMVKVWEELKRAAGIVTPKMKAFLRMQELRKETSKYDISEAQRETALDEKFGTFG